MTVVVGAIKGESVILVSDSRATARIGGVSEISDDRLQKVIGLSANLIIGYAGDVSAVNDILRELSSYVEISHTRKELLSEITNLCVAKIGERLTSFSLLAATFEDGSWKLHLFEYEAAYSAQPVETFKLIGSGSVAQGAIEQFYNTNIDGNYDDKQFVDKLVMTLSSRLSGDDVVGVGGLPQALILDSGGVRTRSTGFVEMTPEGEPRSKQIVFEGGHWLQKDLASGSEMMIITPNEMLSTDASEHIFHNYEKNQTPPSEMKWYMNSFMLCQDIKITPNSIEFIGGLTSLMVGGFPKEIEAWLYMSVFGPSTGHDMKIVLRYPSDEPKVLHEEHFENEGFPFEYENQYKLKLQITEPGDYYLECIIDDAVRASRLINVHPYQDNLSEAANIQSNAEVMNRYIDSESLSPRLTLFTLSTDEPQRSNNFEKITGQFCSVYYRHYPLEFNAFAYLLIQGNPGVYEFRFELFDASNHEKMYEGGSRVECTSVLLKKPLLAKVTLKFNKPGYYFFVAYIDGVMQGAHVVIADTVPATLGFGMTEEAVASLQENEYHVLAKRPIDVNAQSASTSQ